MTDTIFALSSGRPPAGIAVVRASGPQARAALSALAGAVPTPRRAQRATLRDPVSGEVLDHSLVLLFAAPASATGEDVAEFHLHGGRAVVAAVLAALGRLPGLRPAVAGEFTRRAFANGRMDLAAVEGLADLIAAETEAQRRQAVRQMGGALSAAVADWRAQVVRAMALATAAIDFPDEGDVPVDLLPPMRAIIADLRRDIAAALAEAGRGERVREGLTVAIAGPPNAGKSSLLNALARREVAIVAETPGTTRDVIEVHLDLGGVAVTLLDTAGLRETADAVEAEGVRRARQRVQGADLVLWLDDLSGATDRADPSAGPAPVWRIGSKRDAVDSRPQRLERATGVRHQVSSRDGTGLDALVADLAAVLGEQVGGEPALVTRERHVAALRAVLAALTEAETRPGTQIELVADDLGRAARELGRITGTIGVEDVLDAVFREFCIGK